MTKKIDLFLHNNESTIELAGVTPWIIVPEDRIVKYKNLISVSSTESSDFFLKSQNRLHQITFCYR